MQYELCRSQRGNAVATILAALIGFVGTIIATAGLLLTNIEKLEKFPILRKFLIENNIIASGFGSYSPTDEFRVEVSTLLRLSGIENNVKLQPGILARALIESNAHSKKLSEIEGFSEDLENVIREFLPSFEDYVDIIAPALEETFTIEEVQKLNMLYSVDEMRAYVKKMPLISPLIEKRSLEFAKRNRGELNENLVELYKKYEYAIGAQQEDVSFNASEVISIIDAKFQIEQTASEELEGAHLHERDF